MMRCVFDRSGTETVRCRRCGRTLQTPYADEPGRVSAPCRSVVPIGMGDVLHLLFTAAGVAALYRRVRGPKPCGCAERQATLNRVLPFPAPLRRLVAAAVVQAGHLLSTARRPS